MQGFFGTGYFNEGRQQIDPKYSYLKQLERKQVLSGVEKLQLLSRLEKAGLTLSKVCQIAAHQRSTHASGSCVRMNGTTLVNTICLPLLHDQTACPQPCLAQKLAHDIEIKHKPESSLK